MRTMLDAKDPAACGGDKASPGDLKLGKVYYFTFLAAAACLLPILTLYYEKQGMTGEQIGFLASMPPLMTLIGASLWGGLADATGMQKRLVTFALAGSALAAVGILFAPDFAWLLGAVVLFSFFFAPLFPLSDNSILELLRSEPHRYGRIRLWGSIGWGIAAPLIGFVVQQRGLAWGFYAFIVGMLASALVSLRLPAVTARRGIPFRKGLARFLRDKRWSVFLAVIFTGGIGLGVIDNYLFLYLNSMHASNIIMGLSLTFAVISEVVVFYLVDRILLRFGVRRVLMTALGLYALRFYFMSLVMVPWVTLPLQLMHGPTYALMWASGVAYAKQYAPEGMRATAQGLLASAYSGLGAVGGALVGGFLYEHLGAHMMYRWISVLLLAGLLLYVFTQRHASNGGL